jgi:hypothetical protein
MLEADRRDASASVASSPPATARSDLTARPDLLAPANGGGPSTAPLVVLGSTKQHYPLRRRHGAVERPAHDHDGAADCDHPVDTGRRTDHHGDGATGGGDQGPGAAFGRGGRTEGRRSSHRSKTGR